MTFKLEQPVANLIHTENTIIKTQKRKAKANFSQ